VIVDEGQGRLKRRGRQIIELYVTTLHRSALTPIPLSRRARRASSETGLSSGFVILSNADKNKSNGQD
jgi:hypothetical protein